MLISAIRTPIITPGHKTLLQILDESLEIMPDKSVLAITSKIVSICEGRVVPLEQANEEELIIQESDLYLPASLSRYGHHFTVTSNTLVGVAGIDKSNAAGHYVLWPADPQATANKIRKYLRDRFGLSQVGVVITDSTSVPFRLGTSGIVLGFSGFTALNDYIGKPDLFGKPFEVSRANVANGLASAAVLAMGEGSEQTPLAVISDVDFVNFQGSDPSPQELETLRLTIQSDLFEVFYKNAPWQNGGGRHSGLSTDQNR